MIDLYCQFCNTKYDLHNGHWEYAHNGEVLEIWYCCHICRDNNEPCETFFPYEEDGNEIIGS